MQVLLPLAGLFDVAKELARLGKQKAKLDKELGGISGKLTNPAFMSKASPEVGWGGSSGGWGSDDMEDEWLGPVASCGGHDEIGLHGGTQLLQRTATAGCAWAIVRCAPRSTWRRRAARSARRERSWLWWRQRSHK
jgi:hypothetical protein